jgi:hypothetical protein
MEMMTTVSNMLNGKICPFEWFMSLFESGSETNDHSPDQYISPKIAPNTQSTRGQMKTPGVYIVE